MLYREAGQLSTSYAMERRTFRLRQDRVGLWLLLGFAFIAVPWLGNDYWFSAILLPLLVLSLAGLGLNLLTGYAGQLVPRVGGVHGGGCVRGLQPAIARAGFAVAGEFRAGRGNSCAGGRGLRAAEPADQGFFTCWWRPWPRSSWWSGC